MIDRLSIQGHSSTQEGLCFFLSHVHLLHHWHQSSTVHSTAHNVHYVFAVHPSARGWHEQNWAERAKRGLDKILLESANNSSGWFLLVLQSHTEVFAHIATLGIWWTEPSLPPTHCPIEITARKGNARFDTPSIAKTAGTLVYSLWWH